MGRKRKCSMCICEICGAEIREGQLTRFQGAWRCDACLEGDWEPIMLPGMFESNMVAWADQETLAILEPCPLAIRV